MIFLHSNLTPQDNLRSIVHQITDNKDILAIRFPTSRFIKRNKIVNDIILGKGFTYDNKIWNPKEIWIYNQIVK
jgi:hypothetical protein